MASVSIKLDDNWRVLIDGLSPKTLMRGMQKHIKRGTTKNAIAIRRQIRQEIKKGIPPRNAELTKAIKGGNKPIVGTAGADMFNAITYSVIAWDKAFVGLLRTDKNYNVGKAVHNGVTIKVTKKMRTMFWYLWQVSIGSMSSKQLTGRAKAIWEMSKTKKFYPLKASTKAIVIPKRPFIRYAMQEPSLKKIAEANWLKSIGDGFKELAERGKKTKLR